MALRYLNDLAYIRQFLRHNSCIKAIPANVDLQFIAEQIEKIFDQWIGYNLAPTLYQEISETNCMGQVTTRYYPILAVVNVNNIYNSRIKTDQATVDVKALNPSAAGLAEYNRELITAYRNSEYMIETGIIESFVEITYWAGYDPLPTGLDMALMQAINHAIETGSILDLYDSIQIVIEQELPGGVSQKFQNNKSSQQYNNYLDKYFASFAKYKRSGLFFPP